MYFNIYTIPQWTVSCLMLTETKFILNNLYIFKNGWSIIYLIANMLSETSNHSYWTLLWKSTLHTIKRKSVINLYSNHFRNKQFKNLKVSIYELLAVIFDQINTICLPEINYMFIFRTVWTQHLLDKINLQSNLAKIIEKC